MKMEAIICLACILVVILCFGTNMILTAIRKYKRHKAICYVGAKITTLSRNSYIHDTYNIHKYRVLATKGKYVEIQQVEDFLRSSELGCSMEKSIDGLFLFCDKVIVEHGDEIVYIWKK